LLSEQEGLSAVPATELAIVGRSRAVSGIEQQLVAALRHAVETDIEDALAP